MKKLSLLLVVVILMIAQTTSEIYAKEPIFGDSKVGGQFSGILRLASPAAASQPLQEEVQKHSSDENPLRDAYLPPCSIRAVEDSDVLNVTWMAPGTPGGDWLIYCTEKNNSIGTDGAANFDVAVRYPATALTDYVGMSLQAVKVWPASAGNFSIRAWTGGGATSPGIRVVNQPFTANIDEYNTVLLTEPVYITEDMALWFGYNCNVTEGFPAGCDAGPAVEGLGNMMYFQGAWGSLNQLADLDYNWCIEGYVGYCAPMDAPRISQNSLQTAQSSQNDLKMERSLAGYRVWRLISGQESNELSWISLTDSAITENSIQDEDWLDLDDANYKWAIKAIYDDGVISDAAFSNPVLKIAQIGTVAGTVRNDQNMPVSGAIVSCSGETTTTNFNGAYYLQVRAGTHSVTASHMDYETHTQENVEVSMGQTTAVNFILTPTSNILADSFETYDDFAIAFEPWTLVDVDQSNTYGIEDVEWLNNYAPQAYIIFNPSSTTPPTNAPAHSGSKMAACFAATDSANDDWLITPQLNSVDAIKFWARSYTAQYGMERMNVGVSTTGTNPEDFVIISGNNYVEIPEQWTEYIYDLGTYSGTPVYIGIQCVSDDAFIFFVDDVAVAGEEVSIDDPTVGVLNTVLNSNYPNPFNPETTISYTLGENQQVRLDIYNVKGQLVRTLVNENKAAGNHRVLWNGLDKQNQPVSSGIYYYKMTAGKYSSSKKMILLK